MTKKTMLYDLIDVSDPETVLNEIKQILALTVEGFDPSRLEMVYGDVVTLFKGKYPGYRASNTKYHDLEHTNSVALGRSPSHSWLYTRRDGVPCGQLAVGCLLGTVSRCGIDSNQR